MTDLTDRLAALDSTIVLCDADLQAWIGEIAVATLDAAYAVTRALRAFDLGIEYAAGIYAIAADAIAWSGEVA